MTYLQDWAAGSNLRSAVVSGGIYGGLSVIWALVTGDGAVAVVTAVLTGVGLGIAMGILSRRNTRDLSGLDSQQRSAVIKAVRRGEAPTDTSLAEATVRRLKRSRNRPASDGRGLSSAGSPA